MKLGNKYFYFIINSFIFTICHYSSLFVTIRQYLSIFSLFVTIRHYLSIFSLFVNIYQYSHYSSLFVNICQYSHYSSLFVTIRDYLHYSVTIRHYSRLFALFRLYCKYSNVFAQLRVKDRKLKTSMTKGRQINLVITYCIFKEKRGTTDGAQVDSKGVRITQQWRMINAIFSLKI